MATSYLLKALAQYIRLERHRFHVPAHAGTSLWSELTPILQNPHLFDLSEVEGLDVLSEPSGCLKQSQAMAATLFGVRSSFFLVNGATVGLMAALMAVITPGDKVLVSRNAHRSILSGLILTGAQPVWLLPERLTSWGLWGAVLSETVKQCLTENPDVKALIVTSPTYEGIGSDIQALSTVCRTTGVTLIVDEAHGGLWPFSPDLPSSACEHGADVVVHSLHKSLGALTQTALAHLPPGSSVSETLFQQALNTLHTTSPSYLLMASIEATLQGVMQPGFASQLADQLAEVNRVRQSLSSRLQNLRLFNPRIGDQGISQWDPCKFYLSHPFVSGEEWGTWLEQERQISYEAVSPEGVLYLANIGLNASSFTAFEAALLDLDRQFGERAFHFSSKQANEKEQIGNHPLLLLPEMALTPREAFFASGQEIESKNAVGYIAKETIVHCPPGIPVLMPGERIGVEHLSMLPDTVLVIV